MPRTKTKEEPELVSFDETEEDTVIVEEEEEADDDSIEMSDGETEDKKTIEVEENDEDENDEEEEEEEIEDIAEMTATEADTIKDNVVPAKERVSKPYLNKYEKTRILATRSKQLSLGAKPLIKIESERKLSPFEVASEELRQKMTPYIIRRKMPDGRYEVWKVSELEDIYTR